MSAAGPLCAPCAWLETLIARHVAENQTPGIPAAQETGVFAHGPRVRPFSFAELLNKAAQLYLQPANPFVVRPGQLDVALGVDHRRVAQPLLQDGNRHAPQHAVAAVSVPEGVRVGPGGVDPDLACRVLHHLADPLARQVQHWLVMVLAVGRRQVPETLDQVSRHRDLPAPAALVARRVGRDDDDRRVLVESQVHTPQCQGLGHPQAGLQHDPEGHAGRVAGRGVDQRAGFLFGEVIRDPLEAAWHPTPVLLPFGKLCPDYSARGWVRARLVGAGFAGVAFQNRG